MQNHISRWLAQRVGQIGCLVYIMLSLTFKHAIQHYHFGALLKLDTNALVINEAQEKEAIALFTKILSLAWLAGITGLTLSEREKVIHSSRYWKDMKEEEIRNYFKEKEHQTDVLFYRQNKIFLLIGC